MAALRPGRHEPALIQVRQTGPTFWVRYQQATESGLLFILIALGLQVLTLFYVSAFRMSPPWTQRLAEETSHPHPAAAS
jgi:hypothetical protein